MNETIKMVHRDCKNRKNESAEGLFTLDHAEIVRNYHRSFPDYRPTPLARLDCLAQILGLAGMYVKDESYRFGLNAFKSLGGSYCLGKYIAEKLGKDISEITFGEITSAETKAKLGEITFVTATDGASPGLPMYWDRRRSCICPRGPCRNASTISENWERRRKSRT